MIGTTEPLVVIGLFSTAIGLFFTVYELRRSAKIAISNAETETLRDFSNWTTKFKETSSDEKKLLYLERVLFNALEHLVKDVRRGVYPFNEYIEDFLPVTLKYFCEFENLYKKKETLDAAKKYINTYHKSLLPVFDYYVKKSDAFLKADGKERTLDNLKNFMKSESREPDKSDIKKLKIIKKRIK